MKTSQARVLAGHMIFHGQDDVRKPIGAQFWVGVLVGAAITWIVGVLV